MAAPIKNTNRLSLAMERTGQWYYLSLFPPNTPLLFSFPVSVCINFIYDRVFSQEIPTDVVVEVGEANFNLHKVRYL